MGLLIGGVLLAAAPALLRLLVRLLSLVVRVRGDAWVRAGAAPITHRNTK